MTLIRRFLALALAASFVTMAAAQDGKPKIATVDMQELFKQYYRTNEAQKQINVERARIQKDNNERLSRIRELEDTLAKLKKQLEEQKRRQEEAARKAAEAEQPVVKPLAEAGVTGKSLNDPATMLKDASSPLSKRSIYYDFDAYNIKDEFQSLVEAHSKFLQEHKEFKVRVEGTTKAGDLFSVAEVSYPRQDDTR